MTEVEWNASADPVAMLDWLAQHHKPSDRKLRLVACRLTMGSQVADTRERAARIEKLCDEPDAKIFTNRHEISLFCEYRDIAFGLRQILQSPTFARSGRLATVAAHTLRDIINPFRPVTLPVPKWNSPDVCLECRGDGHLEATRFDGADAMPCPHCSESGLRWITPLVLSLAEAAYQERDPSGTLDPFRLGLLSDALEEAGMPTDETCCRCGGTGGLGGGRKVPASRTKLCDACGGRLQLPHPLLAHLREPGPHYRGCFAIDLLTGRN